MNFQDIFLNLQRYWAAQGCIIQQPVDQETGAGTLNPATFLRVLGPEPWNVAYVEPCRRPTDGRYAENPYRLGAYYQFQVIMKPSPKNIMELYLDSLRALGIDPMAHDIRFVEDDWEQPTLGAWGLGWEVWADGMEVTQFTYFQQAGQLNLDPVAVELTYGLERIGMYLQGVDDVYDLEWVDGIKYRDVHRQSEIEYSHYCFEDANNELLSRHLDEYEAEALRLFEKGRVLPGYDYVLKANHAFNVLDARQAISVTERQNTIKRIRRLSRSAAETYVASREALEFPLSRRLGAHTSPSAPAPSGEALQGREFFLEIGAEEIPAGFIEPALAYLAEKLAKNLDDARLAHGAIHTAGTPRRLAVWIDDVAPGQEDREEVRTGPPARIAFDAEGKPTRAAEGFARKQGVSPDALFKLETDRGEYVAARVHLKGKTTAELLPGVLAEIVANIPFKKSMRWGRESVTFARPVHWIVALYGGHVVPFVFGDVASGRTSQGHRFMSPGAIEVTGAAQWQEAMAAAHVMVSIEARRQIIRDDLQKMAQQIGGQVVEDEALVAEVANLVETPIGALGSFDEANLKLPREVLISAMRGHQRYFAFEDADGKLLAHFGVFNNTAVIDPAVVTRGHERVLEARLYDARFFYDEDRKGTLEARLPMLGRVTFLGKLAKAGIGADLLSQSERVRAIAERIAQMAYPGDEVLLGHVRRAAKLAKADLMTRMVNEFPDLEGIIGGYYAAAEGEPEAVAVAIREHYQPRGAGDAAASSPAGVCLALADKIERLAACYAVGVVPSGNKDPQGLRRAALGVLRTLDAAERDVDLRAVLRAAAEIVLGADGDEKVATIADEILTFFGGRLRAELTDLYRTDIVDAVLAAGYDRTLDARRRAEALDHVAREADLAPLGEAFKRIHNILQKNAADVDDAADFQEDRVVQQEEATLGELARELRTTVAKQLEEGDYRAALGQLVRLQQPLDDFFTEVMVMHEDPALRTNRLALLLHLRRTFASVADVSRIQVRAGD